MSNKDEDNGGKFITTEKFSIFSGDYKDKIINYLKALKTNTDVTIATYSSNDTNFIKEILSHSMLLNVSFMLINSRTT